LVMTTPTFNTFLVVLTGWVFARRRTVTGVILAADAVSTKHHSSFHRLFAHGPRGTLMIWVWRCSASSSRGCLTIR